jgi:dTDP-4-dehydrorhamnose reductase
MSQIWVTGANGLVGSALVRAGCNGAARQQLDITSSQAISRFLDEQRPQAIINAAAQANVNLADVEKELSYEVNGYAVGRLASICREKGVRFVHISTDYVLDQPEEELLTEEMPTNPRSEYARSKLLGEELALEQDAVVIRIQWVYRPGYLNFFTKALKWMQEGREISLVHDQIGTPTAAHALAKGLVVAAESGPTGLFQLSCQGETSAEGWIRAAAELAGITVCATSVSRTSFSGPYRPARSVLSSERFFETWGMRLPHWKEALEESIKQNPPESWL